jgi:hypothetical protein
MSNLLKDASILLTPTGYDNGRMNAIKPYKDLYGPELVTNGDFATNSDWTVGSSWTISGGSANCDGGTSNLDQASIVTNTKYKVTVTVSNITTGTLAVRLGGSNVDVLSLTENGTYTGYGLSNSDVFRLRSQSGFDGSVENVSVVEDLSGDFTFSRSSAATRVNAQGLVENVQIISPELVSNGDFSQIGTEEVLNGNFSQEGSELVTNGDFSNGLANWVVDDGTSWTNVNDTAFCDGNNGLIRQNITSTQNKVYKVTFDTIATNSSGKELGVRIDAGTYAWNSYSTGTHTIYLTAGSNGFEGVLFYATGGWTGSIDNVSVKEVGQDWSLANGWSIGDGKALSDGTINTSISQSNVFTIGKSYKVTISVNDVVGSLDARFWMGTGGDKINISSQGDYTAYWKADGTDLLATTLSGNTATYSITNISVKEVGQDWSLGDGWTISNLGATCSDLNNNLTQDVGVTAGKSYKVTLDITDYTSGTLAIDIGGSANQTATSLGSKTFYFTTTSTGLLRFYGGAFRGTITNISVKEITDDTDIPRINYSGFSYQDTLGSELVVNGDFSNGSANWFNPDGAATFSNNSVTINGGSGNRRINQPNVTSPTTSQFKLQYEITEKVGTSDLKVYTNNSGSAAYTIVPSTIGVHTFYFNSNLTTFYFNFSNSSGSITIDNVSVKEYLGQEIVPSSGCGSWLLEPQSTNLITYSEDFSQWTKQSGGTGLAPIITSNNAISPDGTQNADKIVFNKGTGVSTSDLSVIASNSFTSQSNTTSFYIKADSPQKIVFRNSSNWQLVDVTTEWQRINKTDTGTGVQIGLRDGYGISGVPNTATVYLWGAQAEQKSYATSYIPTNGATNTRLQDIATNSGNASLINSTEGVLYVEIAALAEESASKRITISDGSLTNRITLSVAGNIISGFINVNNVTQYTFFESGQNITSYNKIAVKYKANDFALWINGVEYDINTSGSIFSANTLNVINFANATITDNDFYGKVKALAVYKEALTDAELQSLTTI